MGLPVEVNNLMLGSLGGYTVGRSLRFRSSATAYLNRTPSSTGNRQKFTWSGWVKRGLLTTGTYYQLFGAGGASSNEGLFFDTTAGGLYLTVDGPTTAIVTSAVFRDPSAWYHIVASVDTTQATAANRMIIYINGVQQTSYTGSYCAQNTNFTFINVGSTQHRMGAHTNSGYYFDGYLAEVNFIDGQALTPSSFGATDTNGVWQPKKYSGTYGTNGFYLPFTSGFNTTQAYAGGFNGSGQFLSLAANAAFAPSTGDFTLEANVNWSALPATNLFLGYFENQVATTAATSDKFWTGLVNNGGTMQLRINQHNSPNWAGVNWTPVLGQWYHIAFVRQSGTILLFINGVQQTVTNSTVFNGTNFSQNGFSVGASSNTGSPSYHNGYISNARYVVGSAVYTTGFTPPSSNLTNITNTQLLTLQNATIVDNSSAARAITNNGSLVTTNQYPFQYTLASVSSDYSGNNNNWTTNNINSTILGTTYDSMIDSPTNAAGNSNGIGNYAVLNAVNNFSIGLTGGNLDVNTTSAYAYASATFNLPASGKWYWEFTDTSSATLANQRCAVGFGLQGYRSSTTYVGQLATDWFYLGTSGNLFNNAVGTAYGATYTQNDVVGIAIDCATGKFWFSKNGTFQASGDPVAGTGQAGTLSGDVTTYTAMIGNLANTAGLSCVGSANFGQQPFSYTPPSGFKALNTYNLPAPSIAAGNKHFDIVLRSGFGTSGGSITSLGFQPDMVWNKGRNLITNNNIMDSIRGPSQIVSPNLTSVEQTATTFFTSFNSNGYSMGTGDHATTTTLVDWAWKGGGTAVTNNSGTITSQVSANTSSGFSIVTYTGTGSLATVGHGLGVAPNLIIWKNRSAVQNWVVYHSSLGASGNVYLNLTNSYSADSTTHNNTVPTSSVFTVATSGAVNGSTNNIVAYCFSAVAGYSSFGTYTANGNANGPFVYTGFRPKWLLLKRSSGATESWILIDTARDSYNISQNDLYPNLTSAETVATIGDILSNGFKLRATTTGGNTSTATYIYAAFAENPFNISRAR